MALFNLLAANNARMILNNSHKNVFLCLLEKNNMILYII